jgi:hypothetical protein
MDFAIDLCPSRAVAPRDNAVFQDTSVIKVMQFLAFEELVYAYLFSIWTVGIINYYAATLASNRNNSPSAVCPSSHHDRQFSRLWRCQQWAGCWR